MPPEDPAGPAQQMLAAIWSSLHGPRSAPDSVAFEGAGSLPSVFAVSDLAAASVAAAALAAAEFVSAGVRPIAAVRADRRLASFWFCSSIRPEGWSPSPPWDSVAGDYPGRDGWIRLHTNAPHHRAAALAVLGAEPKREAVAARVANWPVEALEAAVVAQGGCAAAMRSRAAWTEHPQGRAVATEPLVAWGEATEAPDALPETDPARPLRGLRVLDLTRVLAGPVATRFLAALGADVLRVDPPDWDEPAVVPDVTLGKRCARLDLRTPSGRERLVGLLRRADVLVHGYRPGALERAGLGASVRRAIRPGLVDVALDAYGWTGPWAGRRGFDSLVQMSAGIAAAGMEVAEADRPVPLPVQALDHATGYILAAAALRGLTERRRTRRGGLARGSLARSAALLTGFAQRPGADAPAPVTPEDLAPGTEATAWGPARRLRAPVDIAGTRLGWDLPATKLGAHPAEWAA
jgi:crotonobetainyl-CoA:carnitine CoA-transferase CaiB-like acyl-CoA transferase